MTWLECPPNGCDHSDPLASVNDCDQVNVDRLYKDRRKIRRGQPAAPHKDIPLPLGLRTWSPRQTHKSSAFDLGGSAAFPWGNSGRRSALLTPSDSLLLVHPEFRPSKSYCLELGKNAAFPYE